MFHFDSIVYQYVININLAEIIKEFPQNFIDILLKNAKVINQFKW